MTMFLSRMQNHIVEYQAAPSKVPSELWKRRGEKTVLLREEDWERDIHRGRMFALDLEELVGFLPVGNVHQKAEVREQV